MIGVVDYGFGNIKAIGNIYKTLNVPFLIAQKPEDLEKADKFILPGVGAFDSAMKALIDSGMKDALETLVIKDKKPVLGICVGMQLLANASDEGELPGLGWVPGKIKKFDPTIAGNIQIPHMGWNSINTVKNDILFNGVDLNQGYYFLHSYYFLNDNPQDAIAMADHGVTFCCSVKSDNVLGVQFHPEKSHANGIQLLKNFSDAV